MIRTSVALLLYSLAVVSTGLAQTPPDSPATIPATDLTTTAPALVPAPTTTAPAPDTTAAPPAETAVPEPDSTAMPASSATPVSVILKNGTERHYVRVEVSGSWLICWRTDGGTDNIRTSDVARIMGDQTTAVLKGGVTAGEKKKETKAKGKPFLRGSPLPETKFFWMVQAGVLARADHRVEGEEGSHGYFDVGGMKNISPRFALGGTLGAADDGVDYQRFVVKPRLRTWLGRGYALDVAPGVFFPTGDSYTTYFVKLGSVGFTGEVAFVWSDWVSVTYVVEAIEAEKNFYSPGLGFPLTSTSETEVFHYVGLKAGGAVGLFLTVLTFAGLFGNAN
jgi:hypothetical protein